MDILSNLGRIIDQVSKDKGVDKNIVIGSVVQGVLTAVRKKYGTYRDIEVKYNEDNGQIELFEFKKVVPDNEFEDEEVEIKYSEALKLDSEARLEDQIGARLSLSDLGRIDAQTAKQIIVQHLRSAEHDIIFTEFEKRKGEVVSGIVRRMDFQTIVVDLDKTEAYIPRREQIPEEQYKSGDRIQGYLLEVRQTTRGPQIIMSRAHEKYLIKLFETEVPEVYEGIVKIVSAAREPGQRAKMSVYSTDPAVHPVGACVGIKGSRVQNITQELKGERIDIIIWEDNPVTYVCNALAPAKIVKVVVDEENKQMQVIVPDDQLSLAIGKKGQNVRLAVKLTGWNLDLISESDADNKKRSALFNLCLLPDMTETMAQSIFQYGFSSVKEIAESSLSDLQAVPGYEEKEKAEMLWKSARDMVEQYKREGKEFPKTGEIQKKPAVNLKEQADEILKRELAQLEKKQSSDLKADGENDSDLSSPAAVSEKSPASESQMKSKALTEETDSKLGNIFAQSDSSDPDVDKAKSSTPDSVKKTESLSTESDTKSKTLADSKPGNIFAQSDSSDPDVDKAKSSTPDSVKKTESLSTESDTKSKTLTDSKQGNASAQPDSSASSADETKSSALDSVKKTESLSAESQSEKPAAGSVKLDSSDPGADETKPSVSDSVKKMKSLSVESQSEKSPASESDMKSKTSKKKTDSKQGNASTQPDSSVSNADETRSPASDSVKKTEPLSAKSQAKNPSANPKGKRKKT